MRELAKKIQISDVLDVLLKLRLLPSDAAPDDKETDDIRLTRWLVSGLLTGRATRIATPGRLPDHLQNTSFFDVSKCRWLLLDQADRLMERGCADAIKDILACPEGWAGMDNHRAQRGTVGRLLPHGLPTTSAVAGAAETIPCGYCLALPPSLLLLPLIFNSRRSLLTAVLRDVQFGHL